MDICKALQFDQPATKLVEEIWASDYTELYRRLQQARAAHSLVLLPHGDLALAESRENSEVPAEPRAGSWPQKRQRASSEDLSEDDGVSDSLEAGSNHDVSSIPAAAALSRGVATGTGSDHGRPGKSRKISREGSKSHQIDSCKLAHKFLEADEDSEDLASGYSTSLRDDISTTTNDFLDHTNQLLNGNNNPEAGSPQGSCDEVSESGSTYVSLCLSKGKISDLDMLIPLFGR